MIRKKEKLRFDAISTKAPVNFMRSSGARRALHLFPELGEGSALYIMQVVPGKGL